MPDATGDAVTGALTGFLHAMRIESDVTGSQMPLGSAVNFRLVSPAPQVQLPVLPALPNEGALAPNLSGVIDGATGVIGKLGVSLTSLVPLVLTAQPKLKVVWTVENERGVVQNPGPNGTYSLERPPTPGDPNIPDVPGVLSALFRVRTHPLDDTLTPLKLLRYRVRAQVTATITLPIPNAAKDGLPTATSYSATASLPPLPIEVPSIAVPTLALLFNTPDFGSRVLESGIDPEDRAMFVFVDNDSPLPNLDVVKALFKTIQDTVSPAVSLVHSVKSVVDVLGFLTGLDTSAVSLATHLVDSSKHLAAAFHRPDPKADGSVDARNGISDLEMRNYGDEDDDWDHKIASLIVLAPEQTTLALYTDSGYHLEPKDGDSVVLRITTGSACFAALPDLGKRATVLPRPSALPPPAGPTLTGGTIELPNQTDLSGFLKYFVPSNDSNTGVSSLQWLHTASAEAPAGSLWHTIRYGQGSWQDHFGSVDSAEHNHPGPFTTLAAAKGPGALRLAVLALDGSIWFTYRRDDSSWQDHYEPVAAHLHNNPGPFTALSCAATAPVTQDDPQDGFLHIFARAVDGRIWEAVVDGDGNWSPRYEEVPLASNDPGPFLSFSVAGDQASIHFVGVSLDGRLWYRRRSDAGVWDTAYLPLDEQTTNHPGPFTCVACALGPDNEPDEGDLEIALHVLLVSADGRMWHTRRVAGGEWQNNYGSVNDAESNDPGPFIAVGCAGGFQLQVVGVTVEGEMWHTYRRGTGMWQSYFGSVNNAESNDPGPFTAVSCAAPDLLTTDGSIHILALTELP